MVVGRSTNNMINYLISNTTNRVGFFTLFLGNTMICMGNANSCYRLATASSALPLFPECCTTASPIEGRFVDM